MESATVHALIGDLAVATHELVAQPSPRILRMERFRVLYKLGEQLLLIAIEIGTARADTPGPIDADTLAPLVEAFSGTLLLAQLCTGLEDAFLPRPFSNDLVAGATWRQVCVYRSGLEFLRVMLHEVPALREELDLGNTDELLRKTSLEKFEPQEVPPQMPASHWWWFGPAT